MAVALIALATVAAYMAWRDAPLWQAVEGQTLTWRFQIRGPLAPADDVVIVAIDDATVASLGHWPIPRSALAQAVRRLREDGARAIAFDLLLVDNEGPTVSGLPGAGDQMLIEALKGSENVVLPFAFVFDASDGSDRTPAAIESSAFRIVKDDGTVSGDDRLTPAGVLAPIPPFRAHSRTAHVNAILDADGFLRFLHPVIAFDGLYFPALPVEVAREYLEVSPSEMAVLFNEGIRLGGQTVLTDAGMRMPVNYYGPDGSFDTVPLAALLQDQPLNGRFRDRVALIGATATGIGDAFATPFTRLLPGVEYLATSVDNILTRRYLIRADWIVGLDLVAILGVAALGFGILWLGSATAATVTGMIVLALWPALATVGFVAANWWLNVAFPVAGGILVLSYVALVRSARSQTERRHSDRAQERLSRFVSPALADHLTETDAPDFEGRMQPAAVLFVDMRGYTALSERLGIERSTALLKAFHDRVESAVARHRGVLDKFMGDGAMVIFGLPQPGMEDAANALACARTLARDVDGWSRERTAEDKEAGPLQIGIGLHYGPTLIARLGGARQHQLTATGDTVNVASRLQDLSKDLGAIIVASDTLIEAVRAVGREDLLDGFEQSPRQQLRGRSADIGIWVLARPGLAATP